MLLSKLAPHKALDFLIRFDQNPRNWYFQTNSVAILIREGDGEEKEDFKQKEEEESRTWSLVFKPNNAAGIPAATTAKADYDNQPIATNATALDCATRATS